MAPELLEPEGEDGAGETHFEAIRNKQTDVYALGMTMLEIITGAVPYSEYRTDMGIYRAIHNKQFPRRPAELSGPDERAEMMWLLLLECWDYDPTARPDAAAVLELLHFKRPTRIEKLDENNPTLINLSSPSTKQVP
ncbi:hypothetical protein BDV93DRAFT_294419 [Ceratobasidium sp. AG-I]|nr:hypothetical protein BDV93DRAFT_294419 [Ceratobasidium sp. AG-I]